MIFETKRLYLRQMNQRDYNSLSELLQDSEVMYAYEHAFSNDEVQQWLDNQLNRYIKYGFGLWAVILKETEKFIGQAGLTLQECNNSQVLEIGYLFNKKYWNNGYATEAAIGCKEYAFAKLEYDSVYSIIRDTNIASQNVAKRNGMIAIGGLIKHYYEIDMPHYIFCVNKGEKYE